MPETGSPPHVSQLSCINPTLVFFTSSCVQGVAASGHQELGNHHSKLQGVHLGSLYQGTGLGLADHTVFITEHVLVMPGKLWTRKDSQEVNISVPKPSD